MKKYLLVLCIPTFMIAMMQISCRSLSAPARTPAEKSDLEVTISKMPKTINKGDIGIFAIKTSTENVCTGAIGYKNVNKNKWVTLDLTEMKADPAGSCIWEWKVPLNADVGIAEFRGAVKQGEEHGYTGPQTFCIEKCPWEDP